MNDEQMVEALTHYLRASLNDSGQWQQFLAAIHATVRPALSDLVSELLSDTTEPLVGAAQGDSSEPQDVPHDHPIDLSPYHALDEAPPLFGSIWTTKLAGTFITAGLHLVPPSVVILSAPTEAQTDDDLIQVAPTSDWTLFAGTDDLLLPESGGHPHIMVQVWNEQPIRRTHLHKVIGELNEEELKWLTTLWLARRGGETATSVPPHALGQPLKGAADLRTLFREFEWLRGQLLRYPVRRGGVSEEEFPESNPQGIVIRFPYPADLFAPAEEKLANAAASGKKHTPCVIHEAVAPGLLKEKSSEPCLAHCISFDRLTPDRQEDICCEWTVSIPYGANTPETMVAQIFDKNSQQLIGLGTAHRRGSDYLILLNKHQLAPGSDPVLDPEQVRILLVTKDVDQ
jgi:hypothetical protein